MNMRLLSFNHRILLVTFLLCLPFVAVAQNGYDINVQNYQERWQKLMPTHTKIQFAGSMGLLSAGVGWSYGKNKQWETDVMLGFVPRYDTDRLKITMTVKQSFKPWNIDLKKGFSIEPLSCGLYLNTIFHDDFWASQPSKYPNGYYAFSTKLRINVFAGQQITYNIEYEKRRRARAVTFFYEFSTNELYIISAVGNKQLGLSDIVHLSLGLKMQIF